MGEKKWIAHFCLALVQLDYAIYHVLTKFALNTGANQVVFCVFRDLLAFCILVPIAFFWEWRTVPRVTPKLFLHFFVLGLTGIYGNQLLFMLGLNLTSPAYAASIQPAIPVFTFLLALANGTESLNWRRRDAYAKAGGVLLTVGGAVLMALYKGPLLFGQTDDHDGLKSMAENTSLFLSISRWQLGIICLIANCFFMATYLAYQAPVLLKYPYGLTVTTYSYLFGTLLMVLTGYLTVKDSSDWLLSRTDWFSVLYAGVFASALNYILMTWSNTILGPSLVALYMPLQPLGSSTLGCIFLRSPLYFGSIAGGLLILAGLYMVVWGKSEALRLLSSNTENARALLSQA